VECAIDSIVEVGFARAPVAEVARRAGVSKGVVTYHFAARDDLIQAVIANVLASMEAHLGPRWRAADPAQFPERFIAPYLTSWIDCIRSHSREVLALVGIYNAFRDKSGRPAAFDEAFKARANEIVLVAQILSRAQAKGALGSFDARVVAAAMKAAWTTCYSSSPMTPSLTWKPTAPSCWRWADLASAYWAGLAGPIVLMVAPLLWRIRIEERPLWPRSATDTAATPWGTSAWSRSSGDRNNDCSSKLTEIAPSRYPALRR
jgi:TetR/AcrR family transcriptional regulator, fatty acid metabolism regulator protein